MADEVQASDAATPSAPVVGWISGSTKDGVPLIEPLRKEEVGGGRGACAESQAELAGGGHRSDGREREEGAEEVKEVKMSTEEWEALKQDKEASMRRVEALTERLNLIGCELLQAFEMRTVLGELHLGVERAQHRQAKIAEIAAMSWEEVLSWRHLRLQPPAAHTVDQSSKAKEPPQEKEEAAATAALAAAADCSAAEPTDPPSESGADEGAPPEGAPPEEGAAAAARSGAEKWQQTWEVDLHRVESELETTTGALQVSKKRLEILEREAEELKEERERVDAKSTGDLSGLRARLRKRAFGLSVGLVKWGAGRSSSTTASTASSTNVADVDDDGLFQRRVEDLRNTVRGLKEELGRAVSSEAALRRSVQARSSALRELLTREATAELAVATCGPWKLARSIDAERQALQIAVTEQLRWNLQLRQSSSTAAAAVADAAAAVDGSPAPRQR